MKEPGEFIAVDLEIPTNHQNLDLSCEIDTVPQIIAMRLPNKFLSLDAQLHAEVEEKLSAFLQFLETEQASNDQCKYVGFCTKKGAPVYLIENDSFPLQRCNSLETGVAWQTYHYVPDALARKHKEVRLMCRDINFMIQGLYTLF